MERSKVVFWIVVGLASVVIVYWVGFRPPIEVVAQAAPDANSVDEPNVPAEANEPAPGAPDANKVDPGRAVDANEPNEPSRGDAVVDANAPSEPNEPNEPADPMEAINLKEVEMKNIMERLARWTGKTIIPSDEAMKQKITIYAFEKLPRSKALQMIYSALHMKGFSARETEDTIFLESLEGVRLGEYPTINADVALATIPNRDAIVQKFFNLENYSATDMAAVIQPLIGEYGHINADENAGSLLVIDTVGNLMRLENIIRQFDVPGSVDTVTEIFEIRFGDPSEIVQMLNILLGQSRGRSSRGGSDRGSSSYRSSSSYRGGYYRPSPNPEPSSSSIKKSSSSNIKKTSSSKGTASSVVVGTVEGPVILIPEPRRKWIIASASPQVMEQIREWVEKLDTEEPIESEYEIVNLRYADPREVEDSVGDVFRDMPGTDFLPSVLIEPLPTTKQVIVFGRKDLREMVKKMILEIDVAPGMFETRHFPLKYADPDQIKTMIEELFSQTSASSSYSPYSRYSYSSYSSRSRSSSSSADEVKVISYVTLQQVTVIASPERMVEVAAQIEEWDKPLDIDQVKPRIITLRNSDPVEMAELLNTLFSDRTTSRMSIFDIIYGNSANSSKIVGPLYGQLTFEDVPGTKKIIVISKIPEAYDVIEQLVLELDREEMAEVPHVITLKYADPEDLSERLNAMFSAPGQQARIRLTNQGLSAGSAMDDTQTGGTSNNNSSNDAGASNEFITLPWSGSAARSGINDTMPISNVIGRIRFVPEPHTKSIMVLAPPEFMDEIEDLISQLDVPGKQVMIQVIIVEIEHTKVTSLGIEFATNPAAFGTIGQNAITALANVTTLGTHGNITGSISSSRGLPASSTGTGASGGSGTILGVGTDVYALIDFLVKETDARILNQQSIWTKDNEEASFFKGSQVAFLGSESITQNTTTQNIDFDLVGMEVRARPSITPENKVDMVINVNISQLTDDRVNNQPVRSSMKTTTNMIVRDGQTLLLGGILFQKDSIVQTKVPGFGDLPLIGGLFRHEAVVKSNSELLVFITPRVIDEDAEDLPEATQQAIDEPIERLNEILGDLNTGLEGLDQ